MKKQAASTEKRRGPGRPATGRHPIVSVSVPPQIVEMIDAIAKKDKVSRSDILRSACIEGLLARTARERKLGALLHDANYSIQNREQVDAIATALAQGDIAAVIKALALDPAVFRGMEQAIERALKAGGEWQIDKVLKQEPAKRRRAKIPPTSDHSA